MATSSKLNLTRDQLASFLQDHEQIRQFERLFATVDTIAPDVVVGVNITAGTAQATAVQALDQIAALAQEAQVCCAANEAKVIEALDRISMLAQETQTQIAVTDNKATQALQLVTALAPIVEGLQMLPPPREFKRARYGSFYDTTTQTAAAINTAYAMTFNTTDISRGVYIGSPTSRIYVDESSLYDLQFSAQLDNTSGGNHLAYIWLRVNGVDVTNSASQVRLKGTDGELVAAWNFFADLKAGDYFELMWSVNDTAVQLTAQAAASPVPGIPSIILTVSNNIQGVQ